MVESDILSEIRPRWHFYKILSQIMAKPSTEKLLSTLIKDKTSDVYQNVAKHAYERTSEQKGLRKIGL